MNTFITRFDTAGTGVRLAVKDLIDMAGVPTSAGCRAVAETAAPASVDAACLAGARAARARIVGRTNLHELALGVTGVNPWYGTPVNPLDPARVPGGSSSGSAVAVATGEADVAFGTDTGGSIRIPSACCGTAGLKTTWGRIPLVGVRPLAPSLDTVGPMARDVAGLVTGMRLLEPGFAPLDPGGALRVARLRCGAEPAITAAVDRALAATGWEVTDLDLPEWPEVSAAAGLLLAAEAWATNGALALARPDGIGADVLGRLFLGRDADQAVLAGIADRRAAWRTRIDEVFAGVDLVAMPTLTILPPPLPDGELLLHARTTLPVNFAGVPAVSLPVPTSGPLPASLQLVGPAGGEELLLGAAARLELAALA